MSECYKCGRTLAEGQVECDPPCFGNPPEERMTDEQIAEAVAEWEKDTAPIDWDKIATIEDLKAVMRELLDGDDRIYKDSPAFEKLKRFLKSEPDSQS